MGKEHACSWSADCLKSEMGKNSHKIVSKNNHFGLSKIWMLKNKLICLNPFRVKEGDFEILKCWCRYENKSQNDPVTNIIVYSFVLSSIEWYLNLRQYSQMYYSRSQKCKTPVSSSKNRIGLRTIHWKILLCDSRSAHVHVN